MNMQEIENRNRSIVRNAIEWANRRDCSPMYQFDMALISEYLNIGLPKCFDKFVRSDSLDHLKVYGAERTIYKVMDRMAKKIIKMEDKLIENTQ